MDGWSRFLMSDPREWVLYTTDQPPKRLVVFVHGFGGRAERSWRGFLNARRSSDPQVAAWFAESDLLFAGYRSHQDSIQAVADRLRSRASDYFPERHREATEGGASDGHYDEILLVAHSLGGVVVRRALIDLSSSGDSLVRDGLLAQRPRLFSPATGGMRLTGLLGAAKSVPGVWALALFYLSFTSSYSDLQSGAPYLVSLARQTERAATLSPEVSAFRPLTLWANPEGVVNTIWYDTDPPPVPLAIARDHGAVCKPEPNYQQPYTIVAGKGLVP